MLIFILIIFTNIIFNNAEYDESAENRYIDLLPEKEKREFLEKVARRILEEVKSKEADPGLVSGEITDDKLNLHSDYVARLLKEETENLMRRNNEKNNSDILERNADSTKTNVDETKSKAQFTQKAIVEDEVANSSKSILRKNDAAENGAGLEKDQSKQDNKNIHIDLTLREGDISDNNTQQVKKKLNNLETDIVYPKKNKNADVTYNNKSIELTITSNATTQDEKPGIDNNTHIDPTLKQGQDNATNIGKHNTTERNKRNIQVNNITQKSHKREPVSIEITFVNDEDYKENPEKSQDNKKGEIPVKVIYGKKNEEEKANTSTNQTLIKNDIINKETTLKNEQKRLYRKSLSEGIDDHAQNNEPVFDNQVARTKRKSKSDTDSITLTETSTKLVDVEDAQSNQNNENGPDSFAYQTTVQSNHLLKRDLAPEVNINITLESTTDRTLYQNSTSTIASFENNTETPLMETPEITSLEKEVKRAHEIIENTTANSEVQHTIINDFYANENYTTVVFVNNTEIPVTEKLETTTLYTHSDQESITVKDKVQHTIINNFDANENETFPDSVVTTNYTGTTTEEIVKMRTKHISGYPEESLENSTSDFGVVVSMENTLKNIENATHTTAYVNNADSNLNASFYALKLSDKELNISFAKEKEDFSFNKSVNVEPEKFKADLNDTVFYSLTSTTTGPITTTKIEEKKDIFGMETPVKIKFGDATLLKADNFKKLQSPSTIYDAVVIAEKLLRQGLQPQKSTDAVGKIKPAQNEYLVYEILPGQQPFVEKQSSKKQTEKRNPKSYPKLTQYAPNHGKSLYIEQSSQIEQPNYAPVYNYAPEYAYYNPKNKYGPNLDDKEVKIVDERSRESEKNAEIEKIFDYEIENDKNRAKDRNGIDEDYYFGLMETKRNEDAILRTRVKNPKQWMKKIMCKGKYCKEPIVTVIQDPLVPPNSDEPQHAHNAMLNKNPPVTHKRQVHSILGDLGYFHHDFTHVHNLKCNHKKEDNNHGSGETWLGPHIDLFYNKKIEKKRVIRSGGDRTDWREKTLPTNTAHLLGEQINDQFNDGTLNSRLSLKISKRLRDKIKTHLKMLNETFSRGRAGSNTGRIRPLVLLTGRPIGLSKNAHKKRPLFLLTGRHKGISKHIDQKTPLILLTGRPNRNIKDNNEKNALVLLTGRLNDYAKHGGQKRKNKNDVIQRHSETQYYDDVDKSIGRVGSSSIELYKDPGPGDDADTEEAKSLKNLNLDVVNLIINMSKTSNDPRLERKLIEKFKKANKLYNPPEEPKKNNDDIEKKLWGLRMKSVKRNLDSYVEAMTNMIVTNNKALKSYDWLSTTVDIRSALTKLLKLCEALQKNDKDIHPKDLQLLKYILYLYSTTHYLFDQETEKDPAQSPHNLKFPIQYKGINGWRRSHLASRRYNQRPWMNKKGLKGMAADLRDFIEGLGDAFVDLHDAIKHIALVTNYRNQRWFENLKEVYLASPPTRKQALEVILHLQTTRLIGLIEESAANGLETNYVKYGLNNPAQVDRSKEEFAFVVKLYLELKKL